MATLCVLKFDAPDGAQEMISTLESMQERQLIRVQDSAIVSWYADQDKPKTRMVQNMAGVDALGSAFWGILFGVLFCIPFLGKGLGGATEALAGHLAEYGIDDTFLQSVKTKVKPGTSALFLLTGDSAVTQIAVAVRGQRFEIIQAILSQEQEDRLRAAFAENGSVTRKVS